MSSVIPGNSTGSAYWRSLDHLADTDEFREFMHREFPAGASELIDSDARREFLKIMGASMALAGLGLGGCRRWPVEEIVPYASRPEGRLPGIAEHFASCMELGGVGRGVLVTSYDGRPIKIEGNPEHPVSAGATDVFTQASVLDLYDPDRSRTVLSGGNPSSWEAFAAWVHDHRAVDGAGMAILCEATSSPTIRALQARLLAQLPEAGWYEYEALSNDAAGEASARAFGHPCRELLSLSTVTTIVSLGSDFLGAHPNAVQNIRDFAASRRAVDGDGSMSRLFVFETDLSLTGANADHRSGIRQTDMYAVAGYLASRILGEEEGLAFEHEEGGDTWLSVELKQDLDQAVQNLQSHAGRGVVLAGASQPVVIQYLAHLMNAALGNAGHTVQYADIGPRPSHVASIAALAEGIEEGSISTLLILGGNPAYNAPADLQFDEKIRKVEHSVHLSLHVDETSALCTWHLNRAHYLESWGDARAWDGTYSICQPLIRPLFDGRSIIEVLALLAGEESSSGLEQVKNTYRTLTGSEDGRHWRQLLHDGLLHGSGYEPFVPPVRTDECARILREAHATWVDERGKGGWEILFPPHPHLHDGRYANNGWLQELPDPISKLTWDNAAFMNPSAAKELGVGTGDMVRIETGGRSLAAPVLRVPGLPARSIVLQLGYGRSFEGRICSGAGVNAYELRTRGALHGVAGATVTKISGTTPLAVTQDHFAIDAETVAGRSQQQRLPSIYREADLDEYRSHPDFAAHRTHVVHRLSLWEEKNLDEADHAWGMSIDLGSCVGCNACVVACQAENNIPIVGKDQVLRGRELHWIRIDRYFKFGKKDGRYDTDLLDGIALQPVTCAHCENAPCEQVCPVAATVHDKEGLNVMVYNRCIGTRYCSNNCPYKVRRFNFFDYHRRKPHREKTGLHVDTDYYTKRQATPDELLQMQFNPEVSVRMRGVMEKCTFCVQRISAAKISAKNTWAQQDTQTKKADPGGAIRIPDGTITPACAQACPAEAIIFGDLTDPGSRVAKLHGSPRSYEMLEELNLDTRLRYLAKINNPAGKGGHDRGSPGSNGH